MRIPRHVGIIPDGNRRWAVKHSKEKSEGYEFGLKPGLEVVKLAKKLGVEEVTFYGFTVDNCKREKSQRVAFSKACVDAVNIISNESAEILVVGNQNSEMFPHELSGYTTRTPANGAKIKVNFLINYGWEWDISNLKCVKENSANIMQLLNSRDISRIDLIIRWGGMRRLSGFLPIQSVYADIFVCENLWPDFKENDILEALNWYQKQDVTRGG
jgi:undecaprenyl diphosphate synthase